MKKAQEQAGRSTGGVVSIESPCGCLLTQDDMRTLIGRYGYVVGGGRPRDTKRCACGVMTQARALARNHKCVAPKRAKREPR